MMMYPFMLSLGIGSSIGGAMWWLYNWIYRKIMRMFICTVQIKHDDETFKWVQKYMKDKGLVKENEGVL